MKIEIPNQEVYEEIGKYARTKITNGDDYDAHVKVKQSVTVVTFSKAQGNGDDDRGSGASQPV